MTVRDMPLEAEAVEQRLLHHPPLAHHHESPRFIEKLNQSRVGNASEFFNKIGRVEVWRGDVRPSMSVSAPFVWRCLSGSTVAPFPHPAHRTGRADFPHPALGQDLTPSCACNALGSF